MVNVNPPFEETLRLVIAGATHDKLPDGRKLTTRDIASQLGIGQRNFQHHSESGTGNRPCPAQVLPELCRIVGNDQVLDALESAAGRVAFRPSDYDHLDPSDLQAAHGLWQEVGEAIERISETIRDGVVDDDELRRTSTALDDVIRECVALKHWLEQQRRPAATKKRQKRT